MLTARELAQTWHRLLFEQDMSQVWRLMTKDFRRVVAYAAVDEEQSRFEGRHAIVEMLAEPSPQRADTQVFFSVACRILQDACVVGPELVDAGTTTRIEAPAYEIVRLYMLEDLVTDAEGNPYLPSGESARALTLITNAEGTDSLRIAGVGRVMVPGPPPTVYWEPPAQV